MNRWWTQLSTCKEVCCERTVSHFFPRRIHCLDHHPTVLKTYRVCLLCLLEAWNISLILQCFPWILLRIDSAPCTLWFCCGFLLVPQRALCLSCWRDGAGAVCFLALTSLTALFFFFSGSWLVQGPCCGIPARWQVFICLTWDCTVHKMSVPSSAGHGLDLSAVDSLTCNRNLNNLLWQVAEEEILRLHLGLEL